MDLKNTRIRAHSGTSIKNALLNPLNKQKVQKGDVVFIPACTIHAIGKVILLAEIQQSSDITYRIHDYDRKDDSGKKRELHLELAKDPVDLKRNNALQAFKGPSPSNLVNCPFFITNKLDINKVVLQDYSELDSFVVYMVMEGSSQP